MHTATFCSAKFAFGEFKYTQNVICIGKDLVEVSVLNRTKWYQMSVDQIFEVLESSSTGLTTSEAKTRLEEYGYNELKFKKISPFVRFLLQFHHPLIYVLLVAALVTGFLGHLIDTVFILGVVIANTIIGFVLEGKAESSIEALRKMMAPECTVFRDGKRLSLIHI